MRDNDLMTYKVDRRDGLVYILVDDSKVVAELYSESYAEEICRCVNDGRRGTPTPCNRYLNNLYNRGNRLDIIKDPRHKSAVITDGRNVVGTVVGTIFETDHFRRDLLRFVNARRDACEKYFKGQERSQNQATTQEVPHD